MNLTLKRRKTWDKEKMARAAKCVRAGELGYKLAVRQFGVPKGTLERYVRAKDKPIDDLVNVSLGRKPVLGETLERELYLYCLEMDNRFYGLRRTDVKIMAFQLAIRNGIKHPFSEKTGSAGKKWLAGFLRRHPQLCVRVPQGISQARVKGFNPESVATFFNLYEAEFLKISGQPHRLFNVDETDITVVQHKTEKVLSLKGKKQKATLTSGERGALTTIECSGNLCASAYCVA